MEENYVQTEEKTKGLGELDLVLWTLENTKHFDFKKQTFTKH